MENDVLIARTPLSDSADNLYIMQNHKVASLAAIFFVEGYREVNRVLARHSVLSRSVGSVRHKNGKGFKVELKGCDGL